MFCCMVWSVYSQNSTSFNKKPTPDLNLNFIKHIVENTYLLNEFFQLYLTSDVISYFVGSRRTRSPSPAGDRRRSRSRSNRRSPPRRTRSRSRSYDRRVRFYLHYLTITKIDTPARTKYKSDSLKPAVLQRYFNPISKNFSICNFY